METGSRCPKCGFDARAESPECPKCGLIFRKYKETLKRRRAETPPPTEPFETSGAGPESEAKPGGIFSEYICYIEKDVNPLVFWARVGLFIGLTVWAVVLVPHPIAANSVGRSFLHYINLVFHEAGHFIFMIFGSRLLTSLGGTVMQALIPLVVTAAFIIKRNPFGASVGLWWAGISLLDIAPYIADARSRKMMLLGGYFGYEVGDAHDWYFILRELGLLHWDRAIARASYGIGAGLIILAFVYAGYILRGQRKG